MIFFSDILHRAPLIAILRGIEPEEVEAVGDALVEAGIAIIEVPLNSPRPLSSIERLARRLERSALVGAGTVLRVEDVNAIRNAGGRLVVMPHADAEVVGHAKSLDLAVVPGFATPTEAFRMIAASADGLKLFPAEGSSPAVLKSIRAVLPPEIPIIPVGGIDETNLDAWRRAGAAGFGIGSALYRPGADAAVTGARARRLISALQRSG